MKTLTKIADWIVAKNYRYWIVQWFLYSVAFIGFAFCTSAFIVMFITILMK